MKSKNLLIPLLSSLLVLSSCSISKPELSNPNDNTTEDESNKEDGSNSEDNGSSSNPDGNNDSDKDEGESETKTGFISFAYTKNGSVTINELERTFKIGTVITLVIKPNKNYEIGVVKQNQTIINPVDGVYKITIVEGENLINVTFNLIPSDPDTGEETNTGTISFADTTNGQVTIDIEERTFKVGEKVDLNITPNDGYEVDVVKNNDSIITATDGIYRVTIVKGTNLIKVTFKEKEKVSEYKETSIFDLASSVENYYKHNTISIFQNKKIKVRGTVVGYTNNNLYLQEAKLDEVSGEYIYRGINVFCGMSFIPAIYREYGTVLELCGKFLVSENFGCQITDVSGGFPKVPSEELDAVKIIKTASENINNKLTEPNNHFIKDFDSFNSDKFPYLNQKVDFEGNFIVLSGEKDKTKEELTLNLQSKTNNNFYINVNIPFNYQPYKDNLSFPEEEFNKNEIWNDPNNFIGKSFSLKGILNYKSALQVSYDKKFILTLTSNKDLVLDGFNNEPEKPVDEGTIRDEVVNIDILTALSKDAMIQIEKAINDFRKIEPNIRINVKQGGSYDQVHNKTINDYASNKHADMVLEHNETIASYVSKGMAYNMDEFIKDSSVGLTLLDKEDYQATAFKQGSSFQRKGTYSLPYNLNTEVFTFNYDYLIGKKIPNVYGDKELDEYYFSNLTWEEFFNVFCPNVIDYKLPNGEYLIDRSDPNYSVLNIASDSSFFFTLANELNLPIATFNPMYGETKLHFNNETLKKLYCNLSIFKEKHYINTKGITSIYPSEFLQKRSALCSIDPISGLIYHRGNFKEGLTKIPTFTDKDSKTMLYSTSFAFLKHKKDDGSIDSNRLLASWLFYKYLTNKENSTNTALNTNTLPIRNSTLKNNTYNEVIAKESSNSSSSGLVYKAIDFANKYYSASDYYYVPLYEKSNELFDTLGDLSVKCLGAKGSSSLINSYFLEALNSLSN